MFQFLSILLLCLATNTFAQKDPHFIDGRNTIVHLFEWKWGDVAAECERFLSVQGYGGVQISPPNENLIIENRPWWERYQPVSYAINTRSGDENAFLDMTTRCNAVGVRIYVDAVINHMSGLNGQGTAGSVADHDGENYPAVPFSAQDFHESCPMNNDQDVNIMRNCELNGLRDLNQASEYVREKQIEFMNHLVDLGVAGFRVDAAKLMWPDDLRAIYGGLKDLNTNFGFPAGAKPFVYQEVIDFGADPISRDEYTDFGAVLEFRYGASLGSVFQGRDKLTYLENWGPGWDLMDGGDAVAFIDNHDNQRQDPDNILTYKKSKPYKMAIAFMLAHPYGTTRVMSSFYFDDANAGPPQDSNQNIISPSINDDGTCGNGWVCEHRWREIYHMVGFRNAVAGTEIENWWSNGDQQIAFSRGNKGFVAITNGGDINETLQTGLPSGVYCDVMTADIVNGACTGRTVTVDGNGYANIQLGIDDFDGVVAIHVNAKV